MNFSYKTLANVASADSFKQSPIVHTNNGLAVLVFKNYYPFVFVFLAKSDNTKRFL